LQIEPGAHAVPQLDARRDNPGSEQAILPDDRALLATAKANPAAFALLFDRYGDPVLNYCYYRLGTWEEAEDAAQQVFANAFAAIDRFRDHSSASAGTVRSWIFTIAHHEVSNRRRAFTRHRDAPLDSVSDLIDPGPSPEELAVAADHQGRVLGLISQLSDDQRRTIELRLSGLTDMEIAKVLGRSPGAVRATQFRAITRLRGLMGREGVSDG
jgi:RNA polymerase sigma-70 factor (ECF subfamily)